MPSLKQVSIRSARSFFPNVRAAALAGVAVAALFAVGANAQSTDPATQAAPATTTPATTTPATTTQTTTTQTTDANGQPVQSVKSSVTFHRGKKKTDKSDASEKVVQSKDTKKSLKRNTKADALVGVDAKLPDKQLYDKAVIAMNKGRFDVARLDLQTMLNTYPDSQYQMRAKLAIADSWYKEGGSAALTQAESEYADFRVFFPNAPEAAEAQMRIGDIYFRQMDKPDRDYSKAVHAEEEYRRMLTDYPNAPPELMTQAKQRLREVQEVMATRESDIASYYAAKENWAAVIARYQTVADTYPLYSHMDDALIGLGDAYEAQARFVRAMKVPPGAEANIEAGRAKLERLYDGLAADQYRKVVLEHSAAPHVEDARDRLAAMNLPIPEPTREQIAASNALEGSRSTYNIANVMRLLILHTPDTVLAAGVGDPTLTDPKQTVAPTVIRRVSTDYATAFAPTPPAPAPGVVPATEATSTAAAAPAAAATPSAPAAPLAFKEVGTEDGAPSGANLTAAPITPASGINSGSVGVEIVQPRSSSAAAGNGLNRVGPPNETPLPAVESAAPAPDRPNEISGATPPAQVVPAGSKAPKPAFDKADESSSKHKKKKGLKKLDPLPQ